MLGMLQLPAPLRRGDRIGVTSPPAGVEGASAERIDFCVRWLREAGFRPAPGIQDRPAHVAGKLAELP